MSPREEGEGVRLIISHWHCSPLKFTPLFLCNHARELSRVVLSLRRVVQQPQRRGGANPSRLRLGRGGI